MYKQVPFTVIRDRFAYRNIEMINENKYRNHDEFFYDFYPNRLEKMTKKKKYALDVHDFTRVADGTRV